MGFVSRVGLIRWASNDWARSKGIGHFGLLFKLMDFSRKMPTIISSSPFCLLKLAGEERKIVNADPCMFSGAKDNSP